MASSEKRMANSEVRYDVGVDDVTAFILAGGRSSRMGSDKALLTVGNQTLLERALHTAAAVANTVFIAGPRDRYAQYGDVVEDVFPDCGPLGGIHAGLGITQTELNLMLAVDTPSIGPSFLAWLLEQARASSQLAVVPEALGGLQPLAAVYHRSLRDVAEQALKRGDYKIGHLFSLAPTRYISETDIRAAGFSPILFRNVNTFEEYEDLVRKEGALRVGGNAQ
ncbi:MAG: molybdenum cofactor guanylyltransferase [Candidatus Korobacteraceae bacterium]